MGLYDKFLMSHSTIKKRFDIEVIESMDAEFRESGMCVLDPKLIPSWNGKVFTRTWEVYVDDIAKKYIKHKMMYILELTLMHASFVKLSFDYRSGYGSVELSSKELPRLLPKYPCLNVIKEAIEHGDRKKNHTTNSSEVSGMPLSEEQQTRLDL